jgi:hypothetical protein
MEASESIVLCEGFRDRAFWAGWLTRRGFAERRVDPWGKNVTRGQFGFAVGQRFLRVLPAQGDEGVLQTIEPSLAGRSTRPLDWLVVNVDSDAPDDDDGSRRAARVESVVARFHKVGPLKETGPAQYALEDGTRLGIVIWEASDAPHAELPAKQTLERLVCAATREVYPARAKAVAEWLAGRPEPEGGGCDPKHAKAFAWSHMAGWYSEHECDDFYQHVWRDDRLAAALEARLKGPGAVGLVASLVD